MKASHSQAMQRVPYLREYSLYIIASGVYCPSALSCNNHIVEVYSPMVKSLPALPYTSVITTASPWETGCGALTFVKG
jgi:hypothetical protein